MKDLVEKRKALYGIHSNVDGSDWREFGDERTLVSERMIHECMPDSEGVPGLDEMLKHAAPNALQSQTPSEH